MYTFGQLKTAIRQIIWPSGEADNLVAAHDKMFVDAMVDLQQVVPCLQHANTSLFPQCSTLYRCGVTVFDAPRGKIHSVKVIDRINTTTGLEDATADLAWCDPVPYVPVNYCYVEDYFRRSQRIGCCLPIAFFFALPATQCQKAAYPIPTDEGLPANLPTLPLGFHYPQTSTDREHPRARAGRWALHQGKIYVLPWIQSTETVVVEWDGIKREWNDDDPVDADPLLAQAVEEYVRWKHSGKYDKDEAEAQRAAIAYAAARQDLWHNCQEENRAHKCDEPSLARGTDFGAEAAGTGSGGSSGGGTGGGTGVLYYNDTSGSATCPEGQSGTAVTIPVGTVSSTVSVADANRLAQQQAEAQLVCTQTPATFTNNVPGHYVASCQAVAGAPNPDGASNSATVPVGTVTGTTQAEANANAQALAQSQAEAGLSCTFWNRQVSKLYSCPNNPSIQYTVNIPARSYSGPSQDIADQLAQTAADSQAADMAPAQCTGQVPSGNTEQSYEETRVWTGFTSGVTTVRVTIPANTISGATPQDANTRALQAIQQYAQLQLTFLVAAHRSGLYEFTYGL